jgi:hypothetical protein
MFYSMFPVAENLQPGVGGCVHSVGELSPLPTH